MSGIEIIVAIVGLWMLYDLTLGWSSPRQTRERDKRWEHRLDAMRRDKEHSDPRETKD